MNKQEQTINTSLKKLRAIRQIAEFPKKRKSLIMILPLIESNKSKDINKQNRNKQYANSCHLQNQAKQIKKFKHILKIHKSVPRSLSDKQSEKGSIKFHSSNLSKKIKFLKFQNKVIQDQINNMCKESSFDYNQKQHKKTKNIHKFQQIRCDLQSQKIVNKKMVKKSSKNLSVKIIQNKELLCQKQTSFKKYQYFYQNLNKSLISNVSNDNTFIGKKHQLTKIFQQKQYIFEDYKKYLIKRKQRIPSVLMNIDTGIPQQKKGFY